MAWARAVPLHRAARLVADQIAVVARAVTYGWGMIPVEVTIGRTTWTTSLYPKQGGYLLPVKDAVRSAEGLAAAAAVEVTLRVRGL